MPLTGRERTLICYAVVKGYATEYYERGREGLKNGKFGVTYRVNDPLATSSCPLQPCGW